VAEGFIREMAKKVAGDRSLDFDGMKLAVGNAIEIYLTEIAGGQTQTNIDIIVDEALVRARSLVDAGKSGLAQAVLRKAADAMRREEEERRERYVLGVQALYSRARDIALAGYDAEAAAEAMIASAEACHGGNDTQIRAFLASEAEDLRNHGRDRGSNVHLLAEISLRRRVLALAATGSDIGAAQNNLGVALWTLGERESGTARLEEAVTAFRDALREWTRERVPLDWAMTQNNLGAALWTLGQREGGTARLEEAVTAYGDALQERTRERVPLNWAKTQNNLGNALQTLGEREGGIAKLEKAVMAWDACLTVAESAWPAEWVLPVRTHIAEARAEIARRAG